MIVKMMVPELTQEELQLLAEIRRRKTELQSEIQSLKAEINNVQADLKRLESTNDFDCNAANFANKQLSIGKKRFNMDPKKGIEYLVEHDILEETPDSIAKFLFDGDGLNKTAIGDYLGFRLFC
jgi:cytohesin